MYGFKRSKCICLDKIYIYIFFGVVGLCGWVLRLYPDVLILVFFFGVSNIVYVVEI